MTTEAVTADWIKRIADDERRRDAVRNREEELVSRQAHLVGLNARRLLAELHAAVRRDVEAFRNEFAGDRSREIAVDAEHASGGFVVRKPGSPAVTLAAVPHLEKAALSCHYQFTATNGLPPREEHVELIFAADGAETLQIKSQRTGQIFASGDALSEYLLGPVFTGRPR